MRSTLINFFFFTICLVVSFSCKSGDKKELERLNSDMEIKKWDYYLTSNSIESDLSNTLLLFSYPTYCGDCLYELNKWNELIDDLDAEIILIVVDRYKENANNFIEQNNFRFRFHTDTVASILNQELIPAIPQKVFFRDGKIKVMNRIGDKKSYNQISDLIY